MLRLRSIITSIAFSTAVVSSAQMGIGPSARYSWVDAMNKVKFGYGLQLSKPFGERYRVNLEGYWTPWETVRYESNFTTSFGPGPIFRTVYEYKNWGLNLDLERSIGSVGFAAAGLGYASLYTLRTRTMTYLQDVIEAYEEGHWDRLAALNVGFGIRWKLGPGDLRAAIMAGLFGYNIDNEHQHVTGFESYGVTLSYQLRIGKKQ